MTAAKPIRGVSGGSSSRSSKPQVGWKRLSGYGTMLPLAVALLAVVVICSSSTVLLASRSSAAKAQAHGLPSV